MDGADAIELGSKRKTIETPEIEELEKVSDVEQAQETPAESSITKTQYPDPTHLAFATLALMVAVFLVALDVHILGTFRA